MLAQTPIPIGETFLGPGHYLTELTGVGTVVSILVRAAIAISGIILILYIIFGGISLISSAGKDDPEAKAKGRQAITTGVIGFIVVFTAYWVVRLIEIITGIAILSPS